MNLNGEKILLKIRGKFKGDLMVSEACTIQTLIREISSASGMQISEFKLIAGGKNLSDHSKRLNEYGIDKNKIIMVVASQSNQQTKKMEKTEKSRSHVEKIVDTAGKLAARSRMNDRDWEEVSANQRANFIFELTDQHGNSVNIPAKDQDALMQGMMLHEKGRHVLYGHTKRPLQNQLKEALTFFHEAENLFRQSDSKYLGLIDNYAYVCLDIVWCLFLLQDLKNLPLAERLLHQAESGFIKAHGPNLERLIQVKGPYCAERALYVRLHLLQGVMAFAGGNLGVASQALLRARQECAALEVDPQVARTLVAKRVALGRPVSSAAAVRALRASQGILEHAEIFLEDRWQNSERLRKEKEAQRNQRKAQRELGKTMDGSWVDTSLIDALTVSGFEKDAVVRCLKKTNNNQEEALMMLTLGEQSSVSVSEEAVVTLISLGMEEGVAREMLQQNNGNIEAVIQTNFQSRTPTDASFSTDNPSLGNKKMDDEQANANGKPAIEDTMVINQKGGEAETNDENAMAVDQQESKYDAKEEETKLEEDFDKEAAKEIAEGLNEDEEAYLDITLEDEALAIEMYLKMCSGTIPAQFNLDDFLPKGNG